MAEIDLLTNEACLIVVKEPRPDLGPSKVNIAQHLIGFADSTPWVYLLLGELPSTNTYADPRVALDLALPQLGGRAVRARARDCVP